MVWRKTNPLSDQFVDIAKTVREAGTADAWAWTGEGPIAAGRPYDSKRIPASAVAFRSKLTVSVVPALAAVSAISASANFADAEAW